MEAQYVLCVVSVLVFIADFTAIATNSMQCLKQHTIASKIGGLYSDDSSGVKVLVLHQDTAIEFSNGKLQQASEHLVDEGQESLAANISFSLGHLLLAAVRDQTFSWMDLCYYAK